MLPSALSDLVDILEHITRESGNLTIAKRFVRLLRDRCRHLASLPSVMGRPRPELRPEMRSFPFRGYVIFFRYAHDAFEVVNILEGHRDITGHFRDRDGRDGDA